MFKDIGEGPVLINIFRNKSGIFSIDNRKLLTYRIVVQYTAFNGTLESFQIRALSGFTLRWCTKLSKIVLFLAIDNGSFNLAAYLPMSFREQETNTGEGLFLCKGAIALKMLSSSGRSFESIEEIDRSFKEGSRDFRFDITIKGKAPMLGTVRHDR